MSSVAVVHLVWAPLGLVPLRAFTDSYRRFGAGVDHELVVLLNGLPAIPEAQRAATRERLLAELAPVTHRLVELDHPLLDLAAYGHAAGTLEQERICILNSYSELLADDWLARLSDAAGGDPHTLAGATGSWESQADWKRNRPLHQAYDLLRLRGLRRDFPPFPNPHLRSNAFLASRRLLADMGLERVDGKRAAYKLESGREALTRRALAAGGRALVVDRAGDVHEPSRWATSRTFRSGDQERLLVADNQTRAYDEASQSERGRLRRATWGPAQDSAGSR